MSTVVFAGTLLVLVAIVLAAGFVGCFLDSVGEAGPPGPTVGTYSDDTILPTDGLVSYWPLSEAEGTTAVDVQNGYDGRYTTQTFVDDPATQSAAAPGTLDLNQPGLLPGDVVQPPATPPVLKPCVVVDGGFVTVPFDAGLNPDDAFTLEAWVRPDWSAGEGRFRCVINGLAFDGTNFTGFVIFANADDQWEAWFGDGSPAPVIAPDRMGSIHFPVEFGVVTHLVATYDSAAPGGPTLTLWVNGESEAAGVVSATPYIANTTVPIFIGLSAPWTSSGLWPFKGAIQDVAIYKRALNQTEITTHTASGQGIAG
jgi:hypothetical protein